MSVVNAADVAADAAPVDAAPVDPVHLVEQRVRALLEAEDVLAARRRTKAAIRTSPGRPELLWLLADVEFAGGDQQAGVSCLAKAVNASDSDAAAVSRQIRVLSSNQLWRETLLTVEQIPDTMHDPLIRMAVGNFYKMLGCHAHAVYSYGRPSELSSGANGNRSELLSDARRKRRISWLRSGGPFTFIRGPIKKWEDSNLFSYLRKGLSPSFQLDGVLDLDSHQMYSLKVRSENAEYEWWYQSELVLTGFRWLLRLLPIVVLPVWLVLFAIVDTVNFISGPPGALGGAAISAGVSLGIAILVVRSELRSDLSLRVVLRPTLWLFAFLCIIAVLSEIAVAEGYDHQALPTAGWWAWVVFGLLVLPAVFLAMLIWATILTVLGARRVWSVVRKHCQAILLDKLVSTLREMQIPSRQHDLEQRLHWSVNLEWAARRVSRSLLPPEFLGYLTPVSADWLRRRAAGWAEELRYMAREVVSSIPGAQAKLEAKLRHEIRCLATGDFGALAWRKPPLSPSRRTTLVRKTIEILRTALVAALPLGAVLVGQAALHFSTEVFRWASIATAAWALLYVIVSLDPAVRDKIDTARSLADTIRDARKINLSSGPVVQQVG